MLHIQGILQEALHVGFYTEELGTVSETFIRATWKKCVSVSSLFVMICILLHRFIFEFRCNKYVKVALRISSIINE